MKPGDLFVRRLVLGRDQEEVCILIEAFTHEVVGTKWWRVLVQDGKVTEEPEAMIKYSIDVGTGRLINRLINEAR